MKVVTALYFGTSCTLTLLMSKICTIHYMGMAEGKLRLECYSFLRELANMVLRCVGSGFDF